MPAPVVFTWVTAGPNDDYNNTGNWIGGVVPPVNGTVQLDLPYGGYYTTEAISLPAGAVAFESMRFLTDDNALSYNGSRYQFNTPGSTTLTLSAGLTKSYYANPAYVTFAPGVAINIAASQSWSVNSATINGAIGGAGLLSYSPVDWGGYGHAGSLHLNGPGSFTGGFSASDALIHLGHASALAGGPVSLSESALTLDIAGDYTFTQTVSFNGTVGLWTVDDNATGTYRFNGPLNLSGHTTLEAISNHVLPVYLAGTIGQTSPNTQLGFRYGTFVVSGDNSTAAYTGGTNVNQQARLIFATGNSVPATGLISATTDSYVGAAFTTDVQSKLVARLDPASFFGTLGLDSDPLGPELVFSSPLDVGTLVNFLGLGSATRAKLTGTLTIGAGQDYRFGGGGGVLTVASNLTQASAGLLLDGPGETEPLKLVLQGANTFTDNVELGYGILVFDGATALPAGRNVSFNFNYNVAYAGYTENFGGTPNAFLARLVNPGYESSVAGLDSANTASPRTVSDPVDLSLGGTRTDAYYLGTASKVILTGTLTAPAAAGAGPLYLTGVQGGHLVVNSAIGSPTTSLVVGLVKPLGSQPGTVELNAANTFTGGTTFHSGRLLLGNGAALGSGRLISDGDSNVDRVLTASASLTVPNSIFVHDDLIVGETGVPVNLTLAGTISGNEELRYLGAGTLTLAGRVAVDELAVDAPGGSVVVTGSLMGPQLDLSAGAVSVQSPAWLRSLNTAAGTLLTLGAGTDLVLDSDGIGEGPIGHTVSGTLAGAGSITLSYGDGLWLPGANTFTGGLTIDEGILRLGHSGALGTGTFTVYGSDDEYYPDAGLLATVAGLNFANPVSLQGWLEIGAEYYFAYDNLPGQDFTLSGPVSGPGGFTKVSTNTVTLANANTFSGGLLLREGGVVFAHNQAAGTGVLWFDPDYYGTPPTATFTTSAPVIGGLGSAEGGDVFLAAGSTLRIEQDVNLHFGGDLAGTGARIVKAGGGRLVLGGSSTTTGGYRVESGSLVFGSTGMLGSVTGTGANAISVDAGAYAGLGTNGMATADFLAKFDLANTSGTIGFDSPEYYTNSFSNPVNLAGFNAAVRLGSASTASLNGGAVITPQGGAAAPYLFGGGGGILHVSSPLTGGRAVDVTSPAAQPLTLWLHSTDNDYTGGTAATRSAVVFSAGSLPATGQLTLGSGGYLGSADLALSPAGFIARLAPGTNQGMIGFDATFGGYYPRYLGSAVNLGAFPGGGSLAIGTATNAVLAGPITPAGGSATYRFGAYKGGDLTVQTALTGAASVIIGDPDTLGYFGDPLLDDESTVTLAGRNTYTGGTHLFSGALYAGPQGLGTGPLFVQPHNVTLPGEDPPRPALAALVDGTILTNNLVLNSSLRLGADDEASFTLAGDISGTGALVVEGDDEILLTGTNTYSGGTFLHQGTLLAGADNALGTGPIHVWDGELGAPGGSAVLGNSIFVYTDEFNFRGSGRLTLNGTVQLHERYTEFDWAGGDARPALEFNGAITGSGAVELDTGGVVLLNGANTYAGGTFVDGNTRAIFSSTAAIPAGGVLSPEGSGAYLGLQSPTASLQADFIDRFSSDAYGTIGFDSPVGGGTQTFSAAIDLSSLYGLRLGSATAAILSGPITPYGDQYQFGGGGGLLTVQSNLTDGVNSRAVMVSSSSSYPSLVRLTGTNTYTSTTNVSNSGLIFGTAGSLPPGTILSMTGERDYIGYDTPGITFSAFLAAFRDDLWSGIIGLDSVNPNSPRTFTAPDLTGFIPPYTPAVALGTASAAIIDGTILLYPSQANYRFATYADGRLQVDSTLTGTRGVELYGVHPNDGLSDLDPTIRLNGANTYSGGTSIDSVRVVLGNTGALGTGTVTVEDDYYGGIPAVLEFTNAGGTVANNFNFYYPLAVDGAAATTLSGNLTGYGAAFTKAGSFTLTLSGTNTIDYGAYRLREGTVVFASNGAAGGLSPVSLEGDGTVASFTSATPSVYGLASEPGVSATVSLAGGTTLTVGSPYEDFSYAGLITGAGGLVKAGANTQTLAGTGSYSGGTQVNAGRLVIANAGALGTGPVTLNGGQLIVAPGINPANAISFGASGGLLSGNGTFGGAVTLGQQAGLAPGQSVGTLTFNSGVSFGGGAFLEFEVQDPDGLPGTGYDTLQIAGALSIDATTADRFTIKLISLDTFGSPGSVDFNPLDPYIPYTWQIASAGSVTGFDPAKFTVNTSSWSTNYPGATIWVSSNANGLFLNFQPIPEPSTYALFALGAGLAWLARRRRN